MSEFKIRNMEEKDIDTIYMHIHQSYVNKYFKDERAQREIHNKKYESILRSKSYIFYIFQDSSDNFIAMVSNKIKKNISEMGIYLNRDFRGRGYSKIILRQNIDRLMKEKKDIDTLEAYILEENIVSKKLFEEFNFNYVEMKTINELEYLVYRKKIR